MKYVRHFMLAAIVMVVACSDGEEPPAPVVPPVSGTVSGSVSIEGVGAGGVTVTISSGGSTTTSDSGTFTLTGVPEGNHTVTLSGFEDDVQFSATSQPVSITRQNSTANLTFTGSYTRTSSIRGSVTVEGGNVLAGVTVLVTGGPEAVNEERTTASDGSYSVVGLRRGTYTVSISGFNSTRYGFSRTSQDVTVELGGTAVASFEGEFTAQAAISGKVMYETYPAPGVTVALSGGLSSAAPQSTDVNGMYSFPSLKPGTYTLSISGYADDVRFTVTSQTYTVEDGVVTAATFEGTFDRTASLSGTVFVGRTAVRGAEVTLVGTFDHGAEADQRTTSNSQGEFNFERLRQGSYDIQLTNLPDPDMDFDGRDELSVMLAKGERSRDNDFAGHNGWINGSVTVEATGGLSGVTVKLAAGHRERTATTDADGAYSFGNLRPASYEISISGYDERRYSFSTTSETVTLVSSDGTALTADFSGKYQPLAAIEGTVTYDGVAAEGVKVSISGGLTSKDPMTTGTDGAYSFAKLKPGSYIITISDYEADVSFPLGTSAEYTVDDKVVTASVFSGNIARESLLIGTVFAGGEPVVGADIELSGIFSYGGRSYRDETTTNARGEYRFDDLRGGDDYTVEVTGHPAHLDFHGRDQVKVEIAANGQERRDFVGHDGTISGAVTIDGLGGLSGVTVTLSSGHYDDRNVATDGDGNYQFLYLRPGSYEVAIENPDERRYSFVSTSETVTLSSDGGSRMADFGGTYQPLASISGRVTYEGFPAEGVTVSLSGGLSPKDPVATDVAGSYVFPGLKPGSYTITISDYEADVSFASGTSAEYTVDDKGITASTFEGEIAYESELEGTVFVGSEPVLGATLTLTGSFTYGPASMKTSTTSDQRGVYRFTGLRKGAYTVEVTDYPTRFDFHGVNSDTITLDQDGSGSRDFTGHDGTVHGTVTVDGDALADVTVTLTADHLPDGGRTTKTDGDGTYGFSYLRPAVYTVEISDYVPDEHTFDDGTSMVVTLTSSDAAESADFRGQFQTLATVSGSITYAGHPAVGVTVELSGGLTLPPATTTDDKGEYSFENLKRGTYTVSISGYEPDVTFTNDLQVTLTPTNRNGRLDFDGIIAHDQAIEGTVFVDNVARRGITVEAKAAFGYGPPSFVETDVTDAGGTFSFTKLRRGEYTLKIVDAPQDQGYDFTQDSIKTVSVADGRGGSDIAFGGTQKREAVIRGTMFLDEDVDSQGEYDRKRNPTTEEDLTVAGVQVELWRLGRVGPSNDPGQWTKVDSTWTDEQGSYSFTDKAAGEYRIRLLDQVKDTPIPGNVGIAHDAYRQDDRSVAWNGEWVHDFPFNITWQRIDAKVAIGGRSVAGWPICLFDTETNANAYVGGTKACDKSSGYLGRAVTGSDGVASIRFERARDRTPVQSKGSDLVAFAVPEAVHPKDSTYAVAPKADRVVELRWERKDSVSSSPYTTPVVYGKVNVAVTVLGGDGKVLPGWLARIHANDSAVVAVPTATASADRPGATHATQGADTTDSSGVATWLVSEPWEVGGQTSRYVWVALARDGDQSHVDVVAADYNSVTSADGAWAQLGNDGFGLTASNDQGSWCAGTCADNDFGHSVVPSTVKGVAAQTYVHNPDTNEPDTVTYARFMWDGTVPPDSLGHPGTLNVGRMVVKWHEVDIIVPAHRELDGQSGFTAMDSARLQGVTGLDVTATPLGNNLPTALTNALAAASAISTGAGYPGGTGHLAFDNVPVDPSPFTLAVQAGPIVVSNDTANVMVLGPDSLAVMIDSSTHLVLVDAASKDDNTAKTRASAFAYKRTDGSITGVVEAASGTSGVKTRAGGIPVVLKDGSGKIIARDTTSRYDAVNSALGGDFAFNDLLDGLYTVEIPSTRVNDAYNASDEVSGRDADRPDWQASGKLGERDARGSCVTNTQADTLAGRDWVYNSSNNTWESVLGNACNESAAKAIRRLADPDDHAVPSSSNNDPATVVFRVTRMNTVIGGRVYNDRTPPAEDEIGNVIKQGLWGAQISVYSTRIDSRTGDTVKSSRAGTGTTGVSGEYSVAGLPEGMYWIEASHSTDSISPKSRIVRTASSKDSALIGPDHMSGGSPVYPKWSYSGDSAVVSQGEGVASFAYISGGATLTVTVTTPATGGGRALLRGAKATLYRCKTTSSSTFDPDTDAGGSTSDDKTECTPVTDENGSVIPIGASSADAKDGEHVFRRLKEGAYRYRVVHDTHDNEEGVVLIKGHGKPEFALRFDMVLS